MTLFNMFVGVMVIYLFTVILFSVPVFAVFAVPAIILGIYILYSCVVKNNVH